MFRNRAAIILVILGLVMAGGYASFRVLRAGGSGEGYDGPTYTVKRGPLTISFVESGTIKAREQIIIKNEVEGRTSIISLIPEGARVNEGDLLVELDSSTLKDTRIDQEIQVQNAEAAYIGAKENLEVVKNQAQSDIELAKLNLEFARQDLAKYLEGEYPYELDMAEAEIALAQEELTRATDTLEWSRKLYKEKYISETEMKADEISAKKKKLDVELAQKSKALLEEYTYKRQLAQLKSDVSQTEMALERTQRSANADVIQAEADLKAKEAEYNRQKDKLQKLIDQIDKTKIYAPADGLVIYATSAQSGGWRGNDEPLDEGQEVRERQELIYLPTANLAKAELSIHESNLKKTQLGLPAIVTVDALPGKTFYGTVERIAPLPDAQSMWMNPDLKVYDSEIYIEGDDASLRTGMSCQAEIIVQQLNEVVYVPLQSVVRLGEKPTVYKLTANGVQPQTVTLGLDNNKMVHIEKGLADGDVVLMNPPLRAGETKDSIETFEAASDEDDVSNGAAIQRKVRERLQQVNGNGGHGGGGAGSPAADGQEEAFSAERPDPGTLTPAQREALRKRVENMTPEEREKLRQQYGGRGSGQRSDGQRQTGGRQSGGQGGARNQGGSGARP